MLFEKVGKEENFQDSKHNKQLDDDDSPKRFAQAHLSESIIVQVECLIHETVFVHRQDNIDFANLHYLIELSKLFCYFLLSY